MTDTPPDRDLERERIAADLAGRRSEARSKLLQVVFGTMVVGVAVAFFPFAQKWAELTFQQRIADQQIAIDRARQDMEAEAQAESFRRERREFLNSLSAEARSANIETRILLAEFFAHLGDPDERDQWTAFLDYLRARQQDLETQRASLEATLARDDVTPEERAAADRGLQTIQRLVDPGAAAPRLSPCRPEADRGASEFRVIGHRLHDADGNPVRFAETPNAGGQLDAGTAKAIVIHGSWGGSAASSERWMLDGSRRASVHVLIDRDGSVVQMVPFDRQAWHSGSSSWRGLTSMNRHSIGVMLANWQRLSGEPGTLRTALGQTFDDACALVVPGPAGGAPQAWELFAEPQLRAAAAVVRALRDAYGVPADAVVGRAEIAQGRREDPGPAFDWTEFRARVEGTD